MTNRLTFMRTEEEIRAELKRRLEMRSNYESTLINLARGSHDDQEEGDIRYIAGRVSNIERSIYMLKWVLGDD